MGKLSKLLDRAGDMFMPKELAPFASILAPMLVGPGFGNLGMGLGLETADTTSDLYKPYIKLEQLDLAKSIVSPNEKLSL